MSRVKEVNFCNKFHISKSVKSLYLIKNNSSSHLQQYETHREATVSRKDGLVLVRELVAEVKNMMDFKMNAVMVNIQLFIKDLHDFLVNYQPAQSVTYTLYNHPLIESYL